MEIFKRIPQKVSEGFYLHAKHATNENSKTTKIKYKWKIEKKKKKKEISLCTKNGKNI